MARVSMLCLTALLAVTNAYGVSANESAVLSNENPSQPAIFLFGASWCAPCIVELRNLAKLAAAAKPFKIIIVWADGKIRNFPLPRLDNVEITRDSEMRRMAALKGTEIVGLPYAAMTDRRGQKCAEWSGSLSPEIIVSFRERCVG